MGAFLFAMGIQKLAWLTDSALLLESLQKWLRDAPAPSRWYLETIAIPGVPVFARLVPIAELAAGGALLVGLRVPLAAGLAAAMILNFHFAAHVLFRHEYLTNAYGPPVLGGLLALALGGARLPFTARRLSSANVDSGK
jgi:uncharacterized membrane protein YphA (DoxX/SURF4 family)